MEFRLAQPEDDRELTRLIGLPMPGELSLSFTREPSYLSSCAHCGPRREVLLAQHNGEVLALCSYFLHHYRVRGQWREVWTVGDFRATLKAASRSVTGRGWAALRERLEGKPALISVVDQNRNALRLFSKQRKNWPSLHKIGELTTYMLPLIGSGDSPPFGVVRPSAGAVVKSLNEWWKDSFLAPQVVASDFGSVLPPAESFRAVSDGTQLLACGALWDQSDYRQVKVAGYRGSYVNLKRWSDRLGLGILPQPGASVTSTFACFLEGIEPQATRAVMEALCGEAKRSGSHFLVYSQDRSKPAPFPKSWLLPLSYPSTLYQLVWPGDQKLPFSSVGYPVCWL